jgi:hypothetical protein
MSAVAWLRRRQPDRQRLVRDGGTWKIEGIDTFGG